jgi:DNA-binding SARP family transcriptional activator
MFLFRLFGGAGLEDGARLESGRAVQRRRLALLAIHSLQHPRAVRRDTLIAWLWPEHDTDRARHLLGDSLSLLRNGRGA